MAATKYLLLRLWKLLSPDIDGVSIVERERERERDRRRILFFREAATEERIQSSSRRSFSTRNDNVDVHVRESPRNGIMANYVPEWAAAA